MGLYTPCCTLGVWSGAVGHERLLTGLSQRASKGTKGLSRTSLMQIIVQWGMGIRMTLDNTLALFTATLDSRDVRELTAWSI